MIEVEEFLAGRGAADLDHPGGTLLAHLRRTRDTLAGWGARPELQLAGLAHAAYGTDGFPHGLVDLAERAVLAELVGAEAEAIVYAYGSCDRAFTYRELPRMRDRFTGAVTDAQPRLVGDFVDLTIANELDVLSHNEDLLLKHGAGLRNLFSAWRVHASVGASAAVDGFFG
jgi:hypothetical protein